MQKPDLQAHQAPDSSPGTFVGLRQGGVQVTHRLGVVVLAAIVLGLSTLASPAFAQGTVARVNEARPVSRVSVVVNKSDTYRLDNPFTDILVGSSDIADVIPLSDRQLYILGKKIGTTNVSLYDRTKRLIGVIDIDVKLDTTNMEQKVRGTAGNGNIRVTDVGGKVVLSGEAGDAPTVDRAMSVAKDLAPGGVVNAMNVSSPQQVMLKVRFVEASRSAARELGVRWDFFRRGAGAVSIGSRGQGIQLPDNGAGTLPAAGSLLLAGATGSSPFGAVLARLVNGNSTKLDMVLTALEDQGVLRRLAEPNLVATSGQSADFLAGGQVPVPVASAGANGVPTVTITYKDFGVGLNFTPTVLARGVISLQLEPSVSELDYAIGISQFGIVTPGLVTRRARTTVELKDGQSFAIAGLLQAQSQRTIEELPWLGSIPVLGALFRSNAFQNKETELVVIVTPYLVKPVPPGKKLKTPLDDSLAANDLDFFLNGRAEIPKTTNNLIQNGQDFGPVGIAVPGAPDPNSNR